jgi:hypothetical protein
MTEDSNRAMVEFLGVAMAKLRAGAELDAQDRVVLHDAAAKQRLALNKKLFRVDLVDGVPK